MARTRKDAPAKKAAKAKKETLSPKERFLIAMTGGKPDRVPCSPDMSNMIPCRLTGKPFWDIYLNEDPPLWKAYIAAAKHFGIDAWYMYARLDFKYAGEETKHEHEIVSRTKERIVRRNRIRTPDGDMTSETTYYVADPPTQTEKPVKDLKAEFAKVRHLFRVPTGYTTESARKQKAELGDEHAFGTGVGYPGFHSWIGLVQGGVETLACMEADCPEVLEELSGLYERAMLKQTEMIVDSKMFDHVLLGASGSITLASPSLFDKYCLPTIKKITRMCKQAGLPTMIHSCGKQAYLVKRCAEETDLDCVNPLEIRPMGDCDMADLKRKYGKKIALMGNVHTTDVMLRGSPQDVERAARKCIDDAGKGGGFILSTGDQCGRDTPEANIFRLVEVCETYGRYD